MHVQMYTHSCMCPMYTYFPPPSAHILQPLLPLFSYPGTSSQNMAQTTLINSYMYFMTTPSNLQTQGNESTLAIIKTHTQYGYVVAAVHGVNLK